MKKSRRLGGMLIFNLQFWMVLSVVMDNGTNAFQFHSRKLDKTIRSEQNYRNHPIDSVYDSSQYPSNFKNFPSRPNFEKVKNREFFISPGSKIHELSRSESPYDTESVRSYRDANENSQYLNRTTIVARLVNGIYLQSGLINGNIPIDALVGELFNFGSVSVSDIINFKSDKVTALANKLKIVRDSLNNEYDADEVEQHVIAYNEWWLKSESVLTLNLDTIPKKAEYLKEVSTLERNSGMDLFPYWAKFYEGIVGRIETIENEFPNPLDEVQINYLYDIFASLDRLLRECNELVEKIRRAVSNLDSSYPLLIKGPEVFDPFEKMIDLMKTRIRSKASSPLRIGIMKENGDKVMESMDDAKSASQEMLTINGLTKSRAHSHPSKLEHTTGLSNGINDLEQLVKDVQDPWVAKHLGVDVLKLNGLSNGLQPLFNIKNKLSVLNEKLKPISSSNLFNSLRNFHEIQNEISGLPSIPSNSAEIMEVYDKCTKSNIDVKPYRIRSQQEIMDNIKNLVHELNAALQVAVKVESPKHSTESFIKFVGFTDLENKDKTLKEIPGVVEKLMKSDELKKIRKLVDQTDSVIGTFNVTNMKTIVNFIKSSNLEMMDVEFKEQIEREKGFYDCVKKFSDKSEEWAKVLKVIQNLRKLQNKEIENVVQVSSLFSNLSKSLSDMNIKLIPETMKEQAKEATTELNKMPDIEKNYKSIAQTVRTLQYASALKQLESSIPGLKNAEYVVNSEILRIPDPEKRKVIVQQWGDHRKHMSELESSIATFKAFESKIDVSMARTMSEYGYSLNDLVKLSDSKIGAAEKLMALEVLIPSATDPKIKSQLEEVKKTLESISILDLEFSNHHDQFRSAPFAFGAVNSFLNRLLTAEHKPPAPIEEDSTLFIIIGILLVVFVVVAVITTLILCSKRKKRKNGEVSNDLDKPSRDVEIDRGVGKQNGN